MRVSKKVALAATALVALATMGMSHAAQPSASCNGGAVTPGTTPLGIGINQAGTPPTATSVAACSSGSPTGINGAVTASVDATNGNGSLTVDGDSTNTAAPCAAGFARVSGNSSGPSFYEGKTGGFTNQSHAESPDVWAQNIAHNCAGV